MTGETLSAGDSRPSESKKPLPGNKILRLHYDICPLILGRVTKQEKKKKRKNKNVHADILNVSNITNSVGVKFSGLA